MLLPTHIATACYIRRINGGISETLFIDYINSNHPLHKGMFAPPGGHVENGESLEESVVREVEEETGIKIRNPNFKGTVLFVNEKRTFGGKPAKYNFKVHIYDAYYFDDKNAIAKEGPLVWVPNNEVNLLKTHEGDKIVWKWLEEIPYFNGKIVHEGEKLTSARLYD